MERGRCEFIYMLACNSRALQCPLRVIFVGFAMSVAGVGLCAIHSAKLEPQIVHHGLSSYEWGAIMPMIPNKPPGVPRMNGRHVSNGIV
jgi:hypothetical protein